jgi:small-conductance mechanosensitive channel
MAFVLGAELFFQGTSFSIASLLTIVIINIGVCLAYPFNAKELIHKFYYQLKIMQLVACLSAATLWGFIGNQTAAYFENVRMAELGVKPVYNYPFSILAVTLTSNTLGESESSMLTTKSVFKKYFKNAIAKIKKSTLLHPKADGAAKVLLIILGIILLGAGIVVLVCGIQCGSAGGGVALGVIGGLALLGLGVWALVGGFRKAFRMMRRPVVN